jgi:hypothetical protein
MLENKEIFIDKEFQRGLVWKKEQKAKFLDSILRGYPIPNVILSKEDNMTYSVLDGQQRLNTIFRFLRNKIFLPNYYMNPEMPNFISDHITGWEGKYFFQLSNEQQTYFNNFKVPVCIVENSQPDADRDLFIRLQAGTPLNSQEKRDAIPGDFSELVLSTAGRENNEENLIPVRVSRFGEDSQHDLFSYFVRGQKIDRGKRRQAAAQLFIICKEFIESSQYIDINSKVIDVYYYKYIGFNAANEIFVHIKKTLDSLYEILNVYYGREQIYLENHELIHLTLLASKLGLIIDINQSNFIIEFHNFFRTQIAHSRIDRNNSFWINYGQYVGVSANSKRTVESRHKFYVKKFLDFCITENHSLIFMRNENIFDCLSRETRDKINVIQYLLGTHGILPSREILNSFLVGE